jgi:Acetoacetate decarboxylase (ADC)
MTRVSVDRIPIDGLQDFRRMPAVFGPTPGPRNLPAHAEHLRYASNDTIITVTARTDGEALSAILPARFRLDGEPRLTLLFNILGNLGWLAGRGHEGVLLCTPAVFEGDEEPVAGNFIFVLWENLPDSLLTGRDELGFPKLYADIHVARRDDGYFCRASWDGFRFFELEVEGLRSAGTDGPEAPPFLVHRHVPRAFEAAAAVDEVLAVGGRLPGGRRAAPDGRPPESTITARQVGTARFSFTPARWEDMPTQYRVVNALASLPLQDFDDCVVTARHGRDDLSTVHVVR